MRAVAIRGCLRNPRVNVANYGKAQIAFIPQTGHVGGISRSRLQRSRRQAHNRVAYLAPNPEKMTTIVRQMT